MNFKVGQKVVCIMDEPWHYFDTDESSFGPKYNEIVTIIGFHQDNGGLFLEGYEDGEYSYDEELFRPLIETDISIFHAILANPHKKVMEDA